MLHFFYKEGKFLPLAQNLPYFLGASFTLRKNGGYLLRTEIYLPQRKNQGRSSSKNTRDQTQPRRFFSGTFKLVLIRLIKAVTNK